MTLCGDYHTHTVYSHGKGGIADNAAVAARKGLRQLAITDHGFGHIAYGVRRRNLPRMRDEIEALRDTYPQLEIWLGVEANITDTRGEIDVKETDKPALDILVCGYHKFVATRHGGAVFRYFLPNMLGLTGKALTVRNTDAYLRALERNPIDILSHPGNFCKCDIREVARACKQFGTYFELNGKRIRISDEDLEKAAAEDCLFIADSDAHTPQAVGEAESAIERAIRIGIPMARIVNIDGLPTHWRLKESKKSADD